ncbi:hypothetical protein CKALI_02925 [Corynebacterium kalinowskii]|uniref:Uncharacterized protein n=1 Tax=Corynebacterium kalinowskii TaxID=2675216 RepID=A0A6B8W1A4_9CORY|nr:hypothetical protein [Corynebacterium kalinowskii]QGU01468.1 hypothetical protein CKALI_02925 [Corynebacterium kalinowskii]
MGWPYHSEIETSALRERLIALGIAKAGTIYAPAPTLAHTIDPNSGQFATARAIFPTDKEFQDELARRVSAAFENHFVDKRVLETCQIPFSERLVRYSNATRSFGQEDPAAFTAYFTLARTTKLPESFDSELEGVDPAFRVILDMVRSEMRQHHGPQDVWLWISVSTTIYAGFVGLAHLNTFGIASNLLPAGKRQLYISMVNHLYASSWDVLKTGTICCPEPEPFRNPQDYFVPPARKLPLNDAEQTRFALFRSAIELIKNDGPEALSLSSVAARIGLHSSNFLPFIEMERSLESQVEEFLNLYVKSIFIEQARLLQPELPPYLHGTLPGVAYASLAMIDPLTFQVLSTIASGSIVPIEFDTELGDLEMGDALKALFTIVEKNIVLGGGPTDSWSLFETTVSLWATVHGLAMLMSCGALSELEENLRFDLIRTGVDVSSSGMVRRWGLHLPGVTDQFHQVNR